MRLHVLVVGLMLIGVWLNIVLNSYVQLGSLKINWLLIIMLVLTCLLYTSDAADE